MVPRYFYAHDETSSGPWSAAEMRSLAAAGRIVVADTVWQEGTTLRVSASRVKGLFAALAVEPATIASPLPEPVRSAVVPEPAAAVEAPPVPTAEVPVKPAAARPAAPARQKRVIGIKGGILMGQDGMDVKYKKKCPKCGHEDPCRSSAPIRVGVARIPYYCRTCRKGRAVEITGTG